MTWSQAELRLEIAPSTRFDLASAMREAQTVVEEDEDGNTRVVPGRRYPPFLSSTANFR